MGDIFTCVGMRDVEFKGSDGSDVSGMNIFFTYEDRNIRGVGVEKVFIGTRRFNDLTFIPEIGSECVVRYNRYGKIADIERA